MARSRGPIRRFLYSVSSFITARIKAGPLKGKRWTLFGGIRFLRGTFEPKKTDALIKIFENQKGTKVFYDIGANIGFFSVLAAQCWEGQGKVFAFEPSPITHRFLKRNIAVSTYKNIAAYKLGVSSKAGNVYFDTTLGRGEQKVSESGNATIDIIKLDDWVDSNNAPLPTIVKIDVEYHEMEALKGMAQIIERAKPIMMIAVHTDDLHRQVAKLMTESGYSHTVISEDKGDTELLFIPL